MRYYDRCISQLTKVTAMTKGSHRKILVPGTVRTVVLYLNVLYSCTGYVCRCCRLGAKYTIVGARQGGSIARMPLSTLRKEVGLENKTAREISVTAETDRQATFDFLIKLVADFTDTRYCVRNQSREKTKPLSPHDI